MGPSDLTQCPLCKFSAIRYTQSQNRKGSSGLFQQLVVASSLQQTCDSLQLDHLMFRSEFIKLAEDGVVCPMCVETVAVSDIRSLNPGQLTRGQEQEQEQDQGQEGEEHEETRPFTGSSSRASSSTKM